MYLSHICRLQLLAVIDECWRWFFFHALATRRLNAILARLLHLPLFRLHFRNCLISLQICLSVCFYLFVSFYLFICLIDLLCLFYLSVVRLSVRSFACSRLASSKMNVLSRLPVGSVPMRVEWLVHSAIAEMRRHRGLSQSRRRRRKQLLITSFSFSSSSCSDNYNNNNNNDNSASSLLVDTSTRFDQSTQAIIIIGMPPPPLPLPLKITIFFLNY